MKATSFILSFLFSITASSQVFIPFSFWRSPGALAVTPLSIQYIHPGSTISFSAAGETGFYAWTITVPATADGATITTPGTNSTYTGRATPYTTDTVTVTSGATFVDVPVVTYSALTLSITSITIPVSTTQDFSVSNGICILSPPTACTDATVTWSIQSGAGSGSINTTTGLFTATATPGVTVIEATDALGNSVTATVTVSNALLISPTTLKLGLYSTHLLTAVLGTPPYTYSVFSGTGSLGCQSTLTGTHTDLVTTINVTSTSGCPINGVIKVGTETICYRGLTGTTFTNAIRGCDSTTAAAYVAGVAYNETQSFYTAPSLIGSATVRVTDSGAGTSDASVQILRPVDVKTGQYFSCALYDEGSFKCWGNNDEGQLGQGHTSTLGDSSLEMGGANPFVNVGTGRTVKSFSVGSTHVCVILDNDQTKCWGNGTGGKLGIGATANKGDNPNEMGDNLLAIDLGTNRYAVQIAAGDAHTCALLDNGTVKCWGSGTSGRLGYGNTTSRGDGPGEMGDNLSIVDLNGDTATKIIVGLDYSCVLLTNATVKCWGENQRGQLGKDSTADLGDGPSEMGSNLTTVDIGAFTALDIIGLYEAVCAHRSNNTAICWGRNNDGQVGKGSIAGADANIGDAASEMAAIAAINFNTGFGTLSKLFALGKTVCAMDTANLVKCWGSNGFGQLLLGTTANGTAPPVTAMNFGTGLVPSKMESIGDVSCALFTNDRIKCFGRGRVAIGVPSGVLLNGDVVNSLGDSGSETGNNLPYINH